MKNKKIISLTIFAVVLVLAGILGLSKVFENGWQNENTVDNSLSANIQKAEDNTVFNYPYKCLNYMSGPELEKLANETDFMFYNAPYDDIPDGTVGPQYAANKIGEAIKFTVGITEQQKEEACVAFNSYTANKYEYNEETKIIEETDSFIVNEYIYNMIIPYTPAENGAERYLRLEGSIDAFSGRITYIQIHDFRNNTLSEEELKEPVRNGLTVTSVTDKDTISLLLGNAKQILNEFAVPGTPVQYMLNYINHHKEGMAYDLYLKMDTGEEIDMSFTEEKDTLILFFVNNVLHEYIEWLPVPN